MISKMKEWDEKFINSDGEFDLIQEVSKIYIKIILTCIFGEDLSDTEIDYFEKGKRTRKSVPFVLREGFHKCLMRIVSL